MLFYNKKVLLLTKTYKIERKGMKNQEPKSNARKSLKNKLIKVL